MTETVYKLSVSVDRFRLAATNSIIITDYNLTGRETRASHYDNTNNNTSCWQNLILTGANPGYPVSSAYDRPLSVIVIIFYFIYTFLLSSLNAAYLDYRHSYYNRYTR